MPTYLKYIVKSCIIEMYNQMQNCEDISHTHRPRTILSFNSLPHVALVAVCSLWPRFGPPAQILEMGILLLLRKKRKSLLAVLETTYHPTWENSLEAKSWAKSKTFGLKSHLNPRNGAKEDKGLLSSCWEKQLVTRSRSL